MNSGEGLGAPSGSRRRQGARSLLRVLLWLMVLAPLQWMLAGCASLPDTAMIERHAGQKARFENARGPLSERRSAALLAQLKKSAGNLDILDKQIALEQALSDSPLVLGNQVTLLEDGAETYPAMIEAIRNARDHINLQSYIIEDDEVGRQFMDLLLQQQARGVQVNILYDSVGAINTPRAFFERLSKAGMGVLEFNPVNPAFARMQWHAYNRDHRKLLVVDGKLAFLGGINISSVYSSGSMVRMGGDSGAAGETTRTPWRDTHVRIEGPIVAEFQKLFLETWQKQHGKPLAPRNYLPELKPAAGGNEIVRAIGSSPYDAYSLMYMTLISAIGNAERSIWITNAYFVPDPQLIDALGDAAARGVDVRLLLPSRSDSSVVFHAGRAHYEELLRRGVRIYEREGAVLHAKTAVIDGVWSTVGSTNLDWRSFLDNDELDAVVIGREFAQRMARMFERDLQASRQIDLANWQQRGVGLRFKERFFSMFGRLL